MNLQFPTLTADQIEVKVKQTTANGAVLLLYKTARVDMDMLDAVVGPMNWECKYCEIKGNLYCAIGVHDGERTVWKMDCGIESREDGEGNEKKGEASDAFKRAGFRWGIGRELYTSPFTFASVPTVKDGDRYVLENKFMRFNVGHIAYDAQRRVSALQIVDNKGNVVFSYPQGRTSAARNHANNPPRQGLITQDQVREILTICSADEVRKLCDKYHINQLSDMAELSAAGVIQKLRERKEHQT